MDPANNTSSVPTPFGNNQTPNSMPPSVDLNSTPPLDQTLVPNSSAPTPPVAETPAGIPTFNATPSGDQPKKSMPLMVLIIALMAVVVVVALGYVVYSKVSTGTPEPTPAPIEQTVEEGGEGTLDENEGLLSSDDEATESAGTEEGTSPQDTNTNETDTAPPEEPLP